MCLALVSEYAVFLDCTVCQAMLQLSLAVDASDKLVRPRRRSFSFFRCSFSIDSFPDMDLEAMEHFYIQKVGASLHFTANRNS